MLNQETKEMNNDNEKKLIILKTNIQTPYQLDNIELLFLNDQSVLDWSIDLEDIDNVLRIESKKDMSENDFIRLLKANEIECSIL